MIEMSARRQGAPGTGGTRSVRWAGEPLTGGEPVDDLHAAAADVASDRDGAKRGSTVGDDECVSVVGDGLARSRDDTTLPAADADRDAAAGEQRTSGPHDLDHHLARAAGRVDEG